MSLQNRDWYWEAYEEKYEKYGGDFSLQSKPKQKTEISIISYKKKIRKICKKCNTTLDLQIPKQFESTYTFICPKCNNKIHIYTWLGYFELIVASLIILMAIYIIVSPIIELCIM